MSEIFITFFYQPLFNLLVFLYNKIPGNDFGVSVIVLTLLIRLLLYRLNEKAIIIQKNISRIQPELEEIKRKYKNDKERMVKETLDLYKRERINPFSGLTSLIIQIPILIALFKVFNGGFSDKQMELLYPFVEKPGIIDTTFLGLIDLEKTNIFLAFLNGIFQFLQLKQTALLTRTQKPKPLTNQEKFMDQFQKQTLYFMPVFTFLLLLTLPSVIGVYWLISVFFTMVQQHLIFNKK
jgi:YidC/Oxa1 family membrane protein insertase